MAGNELQGLFGDAEVFRICRVAKNLRLIIGIVPCILLINPVQISPVSSIKWIYLVAGGKYSDSCWKEATGYFKGAVKEERWQETAEGVRKPLGKVISRQVKSKSYHTSLPGAPDGEYVVIQFETSFENKKSAIETVTPMMDKDGKWRVSGYFIK